MCVGVGTEVTQQVRVKLPISLLVSHFKGSVMKTPRALLNAAQGGHVFDVKYLMMTVRES